MSLFRKKDLQVESKQFGKTHKKKITYVVSMDDTFCYKELFCDCPQTPMTVVKLNGKVAEQNSDWMPMVQFPNPGATSMNRIHKSLQPIMGELSATIVQYLDKTDGKPVITLFPQNHVFFHNVGTTAWATVVKQDNVTCMVFEQSATEKGLEELQRLNHASRRDLFRQVSKRQALIKEYNAQRKSL